MFIKIDFLKNSSNFTGKDLCWSQHRSFPVRFAKFLRKPFLQSIPGGCFCTNIKLSLAKVSQAFRENILSFLQGCSQNLEVVVFPEYCCQKGPFLQPLIPLFVLKLDKITPTALFWSGRLKFSRLLLSYVARMKTCPTNVTVFSIVRATSSEDSNSAGSSSSATVLAFSTITQSLPSGPVMSPTRSCIFLYALSISTCSGSFLRDVVWGDYSRILTTSRLAGHRASSKICFYVFFCYELLWSFIFIAVEFLRKGPLLSVLFLYYSETFVL